ncbi:MAG TPA: 3-methyl-2-oxobutanoate hydroxymethyltransferase, partial [Bryobacteraceae bacterium]|nr:3-methyl-2-oxobutanoate hydroxymethyltransferase [Bryobacteraceae bacterium]
VDVLLVGDSLGMVVLGHDTTIPVTLDDMVHHSAAVRRGARRALIVADMPFLTYQVSEDEALKNAGRLIQQGGAAAVKVEGAGPVIGVVQRLSQTGIPVMAHVGLTPQWVHHLGGFRPQGRTEEAAQALLEDARRLEDAGAFAVVVESVPHDLAHQITEALTIPSIGIGAGLHCDGQVLVSYDLLGISIGRVPPFVKQYARLGDEIVRAVEAYARDVRESGE